MQTAFAELNVSVSSELAFIATNAPPAQGANGEPKSPDKAAGDTVLRNPLLEPNPPPPIFGNAASTTPIDVATDVPPMPLAAAVAAEVATDGKTDDDMSTPEAPKRTAEQSAMACAQHWIKMVRVSSSEEKGKGKGKSGSQVKDEDAEA